MACHNNSTMHAGAARCYARALACVPCLLDVARGCAQLARCSLQCSGYHTALSAAAAALWIMLPAAELHSRFEKPLAVFVRLLFKSLFTLGFTADEKTPSESQGRPSSTSSRDTSGRWPLQLLLEGMSSSNVPCVANMNVPTGQLSSTVRRSSTSTYINVIFWFPEALRRAVFILMLCFGLHSSQPPVAGKILDE